jgi:signal transduction histidine kinase
MDQRLLAAITTLRRIATALRPVALDNGGLFYALQALRRDFIAQHRIACTLFADEAELQLDDSYSTAVYRMVQEGLSNVARHAQASNVELSIYRLDGGLFISICDDGIGIGEQDLAKPGSLGLLGMRERVWALQGEISIGRDDKCGTRIDITLPLAQ